MAAAHYDREDGLPPSAPPHAAADAYDPNYVPDSVKTFVVHLYRHIRDKNVYEIHQMYEGGFQRLSDRLFRDVFWPSAEAVSPYCDGDHVFLLLYRELWYRHAHARLSPLTAAHRAESWTNYCDLFSVVLHGVVNMQLPNQWLWDMVDEFVYQFQSFCQYRAKLKTKTEDELNQLKQFDKAWNVYGVLNYLQALVEKSMITQILEKEKEGLEQFTATDGYDYEGGSNVLKVLGYYSMIGLLRIHCLLGDYHTGLKCLTPIDLNQQGVYTIVIGSHISAIYHYGFANLMMRRYVEATREFNKILLYILKYKQYHQNSPQYDQILKKNEQMYALLAICLSLCPQNKLIDENVSTQLKEKYNDKMTKMQRYDDEAYAAYDELFSYACPKFITPSPPILDQPLTNYNQTVIFLARLIVQEALPILALPGKPNLLQQDAYRLQLKLFLYEVKQQQLLSGIRSYLKLYSTITISKLAQYMEVDEATLRSILMTYKHKMHAVDSEGKIVSSADFDFYIVEDVIHVVESKPTKRHGDYFLRQILKFEEMIGELEKVQLD
ncbi:RNA polymerase I-associated factor PAF67 [Zea mays]|uniref:Eukaryotic translation initiation factor 3 subunit L n=1 Tax=Zea mays TaxID=4577 RepID=A0A1D6MF47_MAIZE|nr:RNA polymerase I-associated factor PAF67 [Zea mays]